MITVQPVIDVTITTEFVIGKQMSTMSWVVLDTSWEPNSTCQNPLVAATGTSVAGIGSVACQISEIHSVIHSS